MKKVSFCIALAAALTLNLTAQANDYRYQQRKSHHEFNLGVCVGQTLSQEGVTVPFGEAVSETLDQQTSTAIKGAVEACRSEMGAAPEPSASPSGEAPTPEPSSS